jgi:hypothetical protein
MEAKERSEALVSSFSNLKTGYVFQSIDLPLSQSKFIEKIENFLKLVKYLY